MRPSTLGLWMAMHEIDPWEENRADWRAAAVASAVINSQGAKKSDGSYFTTEDFAPYAKLQLDPDELRKLEIERDEAALLAFFDRLGICKARRYLEGD